MNEQGSTFLWTPVLIILIEIILGGFILKTIFNFGRYYWKQFIASYTTKKKSKKKKPKKKESSSEEEEEEEEDYDYYSDSSSE